MALLDPQNQEDNIDPNKDYLAELTGPGGKFDRTKYESDEDMYKAMARGKFEADRMINFKNREFDTLKEDYLKLHDDYKASASLSELIDRLSKQQTESNESTNNVNEVEKPALTQEDIDKLLEQKLESRLTQREIEKREQENYKTVENKLKEHLGDNYSNVLKRQADQLGLTVDEVELLAKRSPAAFFKAFGIDEARGDNNFQAPPRSNMRSDSFAPSNPNKRTWSYYEKLRKEKPSEYLSGKTQTQMMKDMSELGDAFKDGNYQSLHKL